jgi:hypothetical protein
MLFSLGAVPTDAFVWFIVALSAAAGGYLGCEVVIAFAHVRHKPVALLKATVFLVFVSLLVLVPTTADALRARWFLAHADSAQGIVSRTYDRGGKHLWMSYVAGDSSRVVSDMARRATYQLKVGDTAWVWDMKVPTRATIGQPQPDWPSGFHLLVPVWLIGVSCFSPTASTPPSRCAGDLAAATTLVASVPGRQRDSRHQFALTVLLQSDLIDPQLEVAESLGRTDLRCLVQLDLHGCP